MSSTRLGRFGKRQALIVFIIPLLMISPLIVYLYPLALGKTGEASLGLGSLSISSYCEYALTLEPPANDYSLYKSLDSNEPFAQRLSVQDVGTNLHLQGQFLDGMGSLRSCASNFCCSCEIASGRFYQLVDIPPPSCLPTL